MTPTAPGLEEDDVDSTGLSLPVAFQKPAAVARLVRVPLGYLRSL
jgi:hypothetical protein